MIENASVVRTYLINLIIFHRILELETVKSHSFENCPSEVIAMRLNPQTFKYST